MIREDFLPLAKPDITDLEVDAAVEVIRSGWLTTGPKVFEFQDKFSRYLQEDQPLYTAGLNSCTSALFLSLKALGIGPGDEVIVPTWTFAATSLVVEWLGASPVLCDIEGPSLNICVKDAQKKITDKTKAIIPVHMAGYPCDMDGLETLRNNYNLKIIEDAAHAIGTKYRGVNIGNFSDVTCFSFYATKNLAMGEGGAAVCRDNALADRIAKLGYFGINKDAFKRYEKAGTWLYDIEEAGYKCNLDSVHAALGLAQLSRIDAMNDKRRGFAAQYREGLANVLEFTEDSDEHHHVFHLFPIILPRQADIHDFIFRLKERNIGSSVHFTPLHRHSHYSDRFAPELFPKAESLFGRVVSLPMCSKMDESDVDYVVSHVREILK